MTGAAAETGAKGPLVRARQVSVRLGGQDVLETVDLAVDAGEIVTLIGPNGAGKTTLLQVVLGLMRPTRGQVTRRPGLTFGYVPQRFHIDPTLPLTVARFLNLPGRRPRTAVAQALDEVGAAHVHDRAIQHLSGGEFQRVMLARSLLRRPDLLVLDEPLQGVDVGGQAALFQLIGRLRRTHGFAVLMVSHDLHLVMRQTDRVVCLNRHVCCHGTPQDVGQEPSYRAMFGQEAAQALAVYTHDHDHSHDHGDAAAPEHRHDAEGNVIPLDRAAAGRRTGNDTGR